MTSEVVDDGCQVIKVVGELDANTVHASRLRSPLLVSARPPRLAFSRGRAARKAARTRAFHQIWRRTDNASRAVVVRTSGARHDGCQLEWTP